MYGPLVAAAAILLGIAGIVLYLSDVSLSRAERAARSFDRTYVRNRETAPPDAAGRRSRRRPGGDHRQATPTPGRHYGMLPRAGVGVPEGYTGVLHLSYTLRVAQLGGQRGSSPWWDSNPRPPALRQGCSVR